MMRHGNIQCIKMVHVSLDYKCGCQRLKLRQWIFWLHDSFWQWLLFTTTLFIDPTAWDNAIKS